MTLSRNNLAATITCQAIISSPPDKAIAIKSGPVVGENVTPAMETIKSAMPTMPT